MTTPKTVLEGIKAAIENSGRMPSDTDYYLREADPTGAQADLSPPLVEIQTIGTIRSRAFNTDFVGFVEDGNGNHVGRIFHARFDMNVQIDVWTAEGDSYDPDDLGNRIRFALYEYDNYHVGSPLPDGDGGTLDEVTNFFVGDGENADDLTLDPAARRWRQEVELQFYDEVNTRDEYGADDFIATVHYPQDGDFTSTDGTVIKYDAPN